MHLDSFEAEVQRVRVNGGLHSKIFHIVTSFISPTLAEKWPAEAKCCILWILNEKCALYILVYGQIKLTFPSASDRLHS